ncbi:MAG: thiamine biosynthesis lipoprotein [Lentimonas sp.]|jgi:thiamine biosynthesis lipoprotein
MEFQSQNTIGKKKHKMVNWFAIISSLIFLSSCQNNSNLIHLQGETQGTTYSIKIVDPLIKVNKQEIDSILHDFDLSLSGYIPNSVLSRLNSGQIDQIPNSDLYFIPCYRISQIVFKRTNGSFDPSVWPLVKLWGFLKDVENIPSESNVDSVMNFVGFETGEHHTLNYAQRNFIKANPSFELDFNAVAQGYSVDVISEYLIGKGIQNFFVEIGGELRVKGVNQEGNLWRVGIDLPLEELKNKHSIGQIVELKNQSIATSGNYRKFYVKNGVKYAHTLNPLTGYPAENNLLSVTVVNERCAISDAYATAFMAMGLEKSKTFVTDNPDLHLQVLLIYTDSNGNNAIYTSSGFEKLLIE